MTLSRRLMFAISLNIALLWQPLYAQDIALAALPCPSEELAPALDLVNGDLDLPWVEQTNGYSGITLGQHMVSVDANGLLLLSNTDTKLPTIQVSHTSTSKQLTVSSNQENALVSSKESTNKANIVNQLSIDNLYSGINLSITLQPRKLLLHYQKNPGSKAQDILLSAPSLDWETNLTGPNRVYGSAKQHGQSTRLQMVTTASGGFKLNEGQLILPAQAFEKTGSVTIEMVYADFVSEINATRASDGTTVFAGRVANQAQQTALLKADSKNHISDVYLHQSADTITSSRLTSDAGNYSTLVTASTSTSGQVNLTVTRLNTRLDPTQQTSWALPATKTYQLNDILLSTNGDQLYTLGQTDAAATPQAGLNLTTILPPARQTENRYYRISRINNTSLQEEAVQSFATAAPTHTLALALIDGEVTIAPPCVQDVQLMIPCDYSMSYPDEDYDTFHINGDFDMDGSPDDGIIEQWGHYALQWKAHVNRLDHGNPEYNPEIAFPPSGSIIGAQGDADRLNDNEEEPLVFPSGNPNGTWVIFDSQGQQASELAVGTALTFDWWRSPVFTSLNFSVISTEIEERPAALRKITLMTSSASCMDEICDAEGWNNIDDGDWTTNDIDLVDNACAFNQSAQFTVDNVEMAYWDPDYTGASIWAGADFTDLYMPTRFEHVMDPPPGEEHIGPILAEVASRMRNQIYVETSLIGTTYINGTPTGTQVVQGLVRMNDMQAQ